MVERIVENDEPPSDEARVEEAPSHIPDTVTVGMPDPPSAPGNTPTPPAAPNNGNLHPVIRIMQQQELGKGVIAFAVPIAMAIVGAGKDKSAESWMSFILLLLCVGIAAILPGILLKETFHKYAPISEAMGIALVATAFFAVIAVFLPVELSWVPVLCIGLCLLPFAVAVWQPPPN